MLLPPHGHRAFQTPAPHLGSCNLPCGHVSSPECVRLCIGLCVSLSVAPLSVQPEQIKSSLGADQFNNSFSDDNKIIYREITSSDGISSLTEPLSLWSAAASAKAVVRIVNRWLQTLRSCSVGAAVGAVTMASPRINGLTMTGKYWQIKTETSAKSYELWNWLTLFFFLLFASMGGWIRQNHTVPLTIIGNL